MVSNERNKPNPKLMGLRGFLLNYDYILTINNAIALGYTLILTQNSDIILF